MSAPTFRFSTTVLGTSDPRGLAAFYRELLGWQVYEEEPDWVILKPPGWSPAGGPGLSFQLEVGTCRRAGRPDRGEQQMQCHLDIGVDDLRAGVARAQALGASLAAYQPQDDVRVLLDPAGHPFCLFADA